VKVHVEAEPLAENKKVGHKDFVTWCIFSVGSLLRFHADNPSEGQLDTTNLQDLLLDKRTEESMKRYVSAYASGSYVPHVMSGWKILHKVLSIMASRQAVAQAGAGSSSAPLLLMPPAESEATDAPVSPVDSTIIVLSD